MNKKYCCTDFHGIWNLWEQIKEYCDETDTIYFLGDACDRGRDGLKIILDLLADKRVVYLRGNHEDMMANAAPYLWYESQDDWSAMVWRNNSCWDTERDFLNKLTEEEQRTLIRRLENLPDKMTITNAKGQEILLCHAGIAPDFDNSDFYLDGGLNSYIWNRRHLFRPWAKGFDNLYIVHGHTPVEYIKDEGLEIMKDKWSIDTIPDSDAKGILTYANGHKFDLDLASFASKRAVLFDLDELKVEKYFIAGEEE